MKKWFGDLTLKLISTMVVGKRFSDAFEGRYQKALRDFLELFGVFVPSDSFPFLKIAKVLDEALDKFLREHRQRQNSGPELLEMEEKKDFMDVLLSIVKDVEELSGYDVDSITKSTCLTLILGGADTTQVTMTWALSLLLNNEEILKKAQLEIDKQVGRRVRCKEFVVSSSYHKGNDAFVPCMRPWKIVRLLVTTSLERHV